MSLVRVIFMLDYVLNAMSDEETIMLALMVIAFLVGLILLATGFSDLGSALNFDLLLSNPLESLSNGGIGSLKVVVGVVLIIGVIAPNALKVIFNR